MSATFLAGQCLKNPEWAKSETWLREFGAYYPTWVGRAFRAEAVDLESLLQHQDAENCFRKKALAVLGSFGCRFSTRIQL